MLPKHLYEDKSSAVVLTDTDRGLVESGGAVYLDLWQCGLNHYDLKIQEPKCFTELGEKHLLP